MRLLRAARSHSSLAAVSGGPASKEELAKFYSSLLHIATPLSPPHDLSVNLPPSFQASLPTAVVDSSFDLSKPHDAKQHRLFTNLVSAFHGVRFLSPLFAERNQLHSGILRHFALRGYRPTREQLSFLVKDHLYPLSKEKQVSVGVLLQWMRWSHSAGLGFSLEQLMTVLPFRLRWLCQVMLLRGGAVDINEDERRHRAEMRLVVDEWQRYQKSSEYTPSQAAQDAAEYLTPRLPPPAALQTYTRRASLDPCADTLENLFFACCQNKEVEAAMEALRHMEQHQPVRLKHLRSLCRLLVHVSRSATHHRSIPNTVTDVLSLVFQFMHRGGEGSADEGEVWSLWSHLAQACIASGDYRVGDEVCSIASSLFPQHRTAFVQRVLYARLMCRDFNEEELIQQSLVKVQEVWDAADGDVGGAELLYPLLCFSDGLDQWQLNIVQQFRHSTTAKCYSIALQECDGSVGSVVDLLCEAKRRGFTRTAYYEVAAKKLMCSSFCEDRARESFLSIPSLMSDAGCAMDSFDAANFCTVLAVFGEGVPAELKQLVEQHDSVFPCLLTHPNPRPQSRSPRSLFHTSPLAHRLAPFSIASNTHTQVHVENRFVLPRTRTSLPWVSENIRVWNAQPSCVLHEYEVLRHVQDLETLYKHNRFLVWLELGRLSHKHKLRLWSSIVVRRMRRNYFQVCAEDSEFQVEWLEYVSHCGRLRRDPNAFVDYTWRGLRPVADESVT